MYVVLSVESKVTTTESIKECITTKVIEGENRKILKITQSKERPENREIRNTKQVAYSESVFKKNCCSSKVVSIFPAP